MNIPDSLSAKDDPTMDGDVPSVICGYTGCMNTVVIDTDDKADTFEKFGNVWCDSCVDLLF